MSYMVCHMSLFLRAGHLGHLKNSSTLPSPGPQEEWDVPQRDTPALGSFALGGPLALLQARCSLCPLCPSTPPPGFCVIFPFKVRASLPDLYSLSWVTVGDTTSPTLPLLPAPSVSGLTPPLSLYRSCSGLLATQATRP